ncbi:MAG: hypothetical protein K0U12_00180 [Gammaproteobacteria bacterium]|nr:hypothetical protein [Gammaproteobacteria bacterium]
MYEGMVSESRAATSEVDDGANSERQSQSRYELMRVAQSFRNNLIFNIIARPILMAYLKRYRAADFFLAIFGKYIVQAVFAPFELAIIFSLTGYVIRRFSNNPLIIMTWKVDADVNLLASPYVSQIGLPGSSQWQWELTSARWWALFVLGFSLQTTFLLTDVCGKTNVLAKINCELNDNTEFWLLGLPILSYPVMKVGQWLQPKITNLWGCCCSYFNPKTSIRATSEEDYATFAEP